MSAEIRPAERVTQDCLEYLGFWPISGSLAGKNSGNGEHELIIEPVTEVAVEVYSHPEAQVRVYVRSNTPTLVILSLLEKIATAIELQQYVRNELDRAPKQDHPEHLRAANGRDEQAYSRCRRCNHSLHGESSIRDARGLLCIRCARELQLL